MLSRESCNGLPLGPARVLSPRIGKLENLEEDLSSSSSSFSSFFASSTTTVGSVTVSSSGSPMKILFDIVDEMKKSCSGARIFFCKNICFRFKLQKMQNVLEHLRSKVNMSANIVKAGSATGAKAIWRGGGERDLDGKNVNPAKLGFMFRKNSAQMVPSQLVNRNTLGHIFATPFENLMQSPGLQSHQS